MAIEPFTLRGEHVELIPLAVEHVDELTRAAGGDRATYGFTEVPADAEAMTDYVARMLSFARDGTALPFAQRRAA